MRSIPAVLVGTLLTPSFVYAYSVGAYYSQSYYQSTYSIQASYATTFTGDVGEDRDFVVSGVLQKGSGTFLIDHPLFPTSKLLYHSFVESPEPKNLYDGVVTLSGSGEAVVELPDYFMALNKDFRYQLKPIGQSMPDLYVKQEVTNNQFIIGGGKPNGRVSWQVTGNRHDAFIEANPIRVEVEKGPDEWVQRGEFFYVGYERAYLPTRSLVVYLRALLGQ
jgi:hypothetical protein